jgi:LemA protein
VGFFLVAVLLFVALIFYVIAIYNGLVMKRNQGKNSFAQISVQLQRRHDLIPQLIEVASRYLTHEQATLTEVTQARSTAVAANQQATKEPSPANLNILERAEGMLSSALGRLMAVSEQYPDLKADALMQDLMEEITTTENRIGFARQAYNDSILDYNNAREIFPNNLLLGFFTFRPLPELKFDAQSTQAPATMSRA